jgi:hypothetical protein
MKFYFLYIEEMRLENKDNTQAVENTRIAAGRVPKWWNTCLANVRL